MQRLLPKRLLLTGLLALMPGAAYAQSACAAPVGAYAFNFTAVQMAGGPTPGLVTSRGIGVVRIDEAGKIAGGQTVSANGFVFRVPVAGSVTAKDDCTGTLAVVFPDGSAVNLEFVSGSRGKVLYALGVDNGAPGTSLTMTFTRTH